MQRKRQVVRFEVVQMNIKTFCRWGGHNNVPNNNPSEDDANVKGANGNVNLGKNPIIGS